MGNLLSSNQIAYNTLVGKPKLITLSAKPLFPGEPITYTIPDLPVSDPTFQFISNDTIKYISSEGGVVAVPYQATQINPTTEETVIIDDKTMYFINIDQTYIDAIPRTLDTYTFDNITFDGDIWQFGTISTNFFFAVNNGGSIPPGGIGPSIGGFGIYYVGNTIFNTDKRLPTVLQE